MVSVLEKEGRRMNTPRQLGRIESQLQAFAITSDIENLTKASEYLRDLISHRVHLECKRSVYSLHTKLQVLFK